MATPRNQPQRTELDPEDWRRLKDLLAQALEVEVSQRRSFLDNACGADPWLRSEIESLLESANEIREDFLNNASLPGSFANPSSARVGRRIDCYQIIEEIAIGGMGEIYRAYRADDSYHKQVALKLVRGGWDSSFVDRFKHERQVLADLDHPNIARLLDGGTTEDGLPYFVMELIDGEPITDYCDAHLLTVTERLNLFLQVCSAVQYAHQRLIIHRDLKPSNILVTSDSTPKLLDFGLAKILAPMGATTAFEPTVSMFRFLTPAYASPEQIKGETMTTASDVYSLAVLLYELLTGSRPYRTTGRAPHEIAQDICELQAEKPSVAVLKKREDTTHPSSTTEGSAKLSKQLRGDLDNIVLTALRKEPERRYSSAEQLASDIRRYLAKLPISASPDTIWYRTSKFVARHRMGVFATLVIAVAVLAGSLATLYEAHLASVHRLAAERRLQEARKLTESFIFELPIALDNGPTAARELVSQKGLEYLNEVSADAAGDRRLALDVALAYITLAEAHGHPAYMHTGDSNLAVNEYQRAIDLLTKLLAADPGNERIRFFLARAYTDTGLSLLGTNVAQAVEMYLKSLATLPPHNASLAVEMSAPTTDYQLLSETSEHAIAPHSERLRWIDYEVLGEQYGSPYYANLGDTSKAKEYLGQALLLARNAYDQDPTGQNIYHLYYTYVGMAAVFCARGDLKQALAYQSKGEALLQADTGSNSKRLEADSSKPFSPDGRAMRDERAVAIIRRAYLLEQAGDLRKAILALQESRTILERLFWADERDSSVRRDLTRNYNLMGEVLLRKGDSSGARKNYEWAIPINHDSLAVQPDQPEVRHRLADSYEGLCKMLLAEHDKMNALKNCQAAIEMRESLVRIDPNDARYARSLAANYVSRADVLQQTGQRQDAMRNYRQALEIQRGLAQKDPSNAMVARELKGTQDEINRGSRLAQHSATAPKQP